jgi:hypothetical protein
LGLGADAATVHSVIAALSGAAALLWPSPATFLSASLCLQIYFILDHVDGELARLDEWRGVKAVGPAGLYLDFSAHFHSVNLVFGAVGVGLSLHTGNVIWAVLGLLADNILGNFPRLVLARTLWSVYHRTPSVVRHPTFDSVLTVAADVDVASSRLAEDSDGRQAILRLREFLFFPGCLVTLSLTLAADAVVSLAEQDLRAALTQTYLILFVVVGMTTKLRRTRISLKQLEALGTVPPEQKRRDSEGST